MYDDHMAMPMWLSSISCRPMHSCQILPFAFLLTRRGTRRIRTDHDTGDVYPTYWLMCINPPSCSYSFHRRHHLLTDQVPGGESSLIQILLDADAIQPAVAHNVAFSVPPISILSAACQCVIQLQVIVSGIRLTGSHSIIRSVNLSINC